MLQVGDKVWIEDSGEIDCGFYAWAYVKVHREATVKALMKGKPDLPEGEQVYALEFDRDFSGGHNCQGTCTENRGQFFAAKHLSLNFEVSRIVVTVPNLSADKLDKRLSNIATQEL